MNKQKNSTAKTNGAAKKRTDAQPAEGTPTLDDHFRVLNLRQAAVEHANVDATDYRIARNRQASRTRDAQIDAEIGAYTKGSPWSGPVDSRPLMAIVADALASSEGHQHVETFVSGALAALADDLEVLHHALANEDHEPSAEVASMMVWRMAQRVRAVEEIARRIQAVNAREESTAKEGAAS